MIFGWCYSACEVGIRTLGEQKLHSHWKTCDVRNQRPPDMLRVFLRQTIMLNFISAETVFQWYIDRSYVSSLPEKPSPPTNHVNFLRKFVLYITQPYKHMSYLFAGIWSRGGGKRWAKRGGSSSIRWLPDPISLVHPQITSTSAESSCSLSPNLDGGRRRAKWGVSSSIRW